MNRLPIGSELVNVSHIKDEDLSRFKAESPADFIRVHVAGIEGEYFLPKDSSEIISFIPMGRELNS